MSKQPASASMREAAREALKERGPVEQIDPETGEITLSKPNGAPAVAPDGEDDEFLYNPAYAEVDPVRQVTVPVFRWQAGTTIIGQLTIPFKLGKDLEAITGMKPPHLTVLKSVKGQLRTLILGAVLQQEIEDAYPNNGYVGKWFAMKKLPREKYMNATTGEMVTKRYSLYQVIEITDPSAALITREAKPAAIGGAS